MKFDIFVALKAAQDRLSEDIEISVKGSPASGRGGVEIRISDYGRTPSCHAVFMLSKEELEMDTFCLVANLYFERALRDLKIQGDYP